METGHEIGGFSRRGIAGRKHEDDDVVLAKGFEFGGAPADVLVAGQYNPGFPARNRQPFLVGRIGRKPLVMGYVIRADLVQRLAQ
ncbi:MAG: hypothetical protein A2143_11895 [Gallionellales bacterium RBG_16_57_15]|nr:MAG: hypothetical protein A2143_11895 [Gallionellales bacterium RBG_16_57_15]